MPAPLRQQAGALELTVATESGSLVAVSRGLSGDLVPEALPDLRSRMRAVRGKV